MGTVTVTATAKETVWIIAAYIGAAPSLSSAVRAAIGDLALTANETRGGVCVIHTSPRIDVSLTGSIGTGGQVHVRRGSKHKAVKSGSKEAKIDALIAKGPAADGAEALNLRLRFSQNKRAYLFYPVEQDHVFGTYG
jgi:hypothetical protein